VIRCAYFMDQTKPNTIHRTSYKQTGQNKILAKINTAHTYNQGHHFIFDVKNAVSKQLERIKHYKAAHYIVHTLHYFVQSPQTYTFVPAAVICISNRHADMPLHKRQHAKRMNVCCRITTHEDSNFNQ
jgi:hypothetical protein